MTVRSRHLAGILLAGLVIGVACSVSTTAPVGGPAAPRYAPIPSNWKETEVDVFPGMDGVTLDPSKADEKEALRGRILWNLWVGDSGKMWDYLSQHGFGTADLLKTIDSRRHDTRFREIGIINQPGFVQAARPDPYGLFIDVPNAEGTEFDRKVDYATYGRSSGVIGLRLSDNPNFDAAAKAEWMKHVAADGVNHDFYENPSYYNDPKLVRPYIVGMACALCHVSFDPVRPPADVNRPKWENVNDYIGAQYFSVAEFFVPRRVKDGRFLPADEESFVWQLIHSSPRGALDTSFVATDYLNNPGTMNGIFSVAPRLTRAAKGVKADGKACCDSMIEQFAGGALDLRWLHLDDGTQLVPRVLKQGDDSVGFEAALSRVFVNIGHAWPRWQLHFRPLIGGPLPANGLASQSPVTVRELQEQSPYWNWSEERAHALAVYFVNYAKPLLLKDAPGGRDYLTTDRKVLDRGKIVFAENCAPCHSSKQPPEDWYGANLRPTEKVKDWFRAEVMKPDFFTDNFLSDERRHPVTQIGTNATRAAATNATRNHIWDNFSSETYKTLPRIDPFEVEDPYDDSGKSTIHIPLEGESNGPGYYRPPSLISLWSSAPFLHNNAVGVDPMTLAPGDVSVAARMRAFQDGIEKMLWIKDRGHLVWTTTKTSYVNVPLDYLPDFLRKLVERRRRDLVDETTQSLHLGPIPRDTPINLIANTNLDPGFALARRRLSLFVTILDTMKTIRRENLDDAQARKLMHETLTPKFLSLNKCPDFIEDKGHPFGRSLSIEDKRALIELLKTF